MQTPIFIKMVLDAWHQYIKRTDDLFNQLTDDQLRQQVADGRNTGVYLLGHLAAVHDRTIAVLGFGKPAFDKLYEDFVSLPDGDQVGNYEIRELRRSWKDTNNRLAEFFQSQTPEQWFEKHTSVSAEDFSREPHRNKLNVIINRTNHLAEHYGQLVFLKRD